MDSDRDNSQYHTLFKTVSRNDVFPQKKKSRKTQTFYADQNQHRPHRVKVTPRRSPQNVIKYVSAGTILIAAQSTRSEGASPPISGSSTTSDLTAGHYRSLYWHSPISAYDSTADSPDFPDSMVPVVPMHSHWQCHWHSLAAEQVHSN